MAFFYVVGLIFGGCGGLIAYGLAKMDGVDGRSGWRWIFIWEGVFTLVIAMVGWWLTVDFPEDAHRNWKFLEQRDLDVVIDRVERDRSDAHVAPFNLKNYLMEGRDWKLWFFALNFLASSVITYTVQYFLPIILQSSLGFSHTLSLCLTAPVSYLGKRANKNKVSPPCLHSSRSTSSPASSHSFYPIFRIATSSGPTSSCSTE